VKPAIDPPTIPIPREASLVESRPIGEVGGMDKEDTSARRERESFVIITGKPFIEESAVMNRSFGAWYANQTRGRARGGISEPARCGQIVEERIYG
jgi:hypothetical protein